MEISQPALPSHRRRVESSNHQIFLRGQKAVATRDLDDRRWLGGVCVSLLEAFWNGTPYKVHAAVLQRKMKATSSDVSCISLAGQRWQSW